jgi:hypothetical protein
MVNDIYMSHFFGTKFKMDRIPRWTVEQIVELWSMRVRIGGAGAPPTERVQAGLSFLIGAEVTPSPTIISLVGAFAKLRRFGTKVVPTPDGTMHFISDRYWCAGSIIKGMCSFHLANGYSVGPLTWLTSKIERFNTTRILEDNGNRSLRATTAIYLFSELVASDP